MVIERLTDLQVGEAASVVCCSQDTPGFLVTRQEKQYDKSAATMRHGKVSEAEEVAQAAHATD